MQTTASQRPALLMMPPGYENGHCFRELFEQPDSWQRTRAMVDSLGYADHVLDRQFSDEELHAWFTMLRKWGLKMELEVGAVKEWGPTGQKTFDAEHCKWDRFIRLGGEISSIGMDEPLCCVRKALHKSDDYAVTETADFIVRVRKAYPAMLIGDIEPYPFIPLADLKTWAEALDKRLAELGVRGLDFFRLDVNWAEFVVLEHGNWQEVKKVEQFCRQRRLKFSLIYWASGQPEFQRRGMSDDSTWYVSTMQQGYDYAHVNGKPDQYVVESWIECPSHSVPETEQFTFTRSVLDFAQRFVPGHKTAASRPDGE